MLTTSLNKADVTLLFDIQHLAKNSSLNHKEREAGHVYGSFLEIHRLVKEYSNKNVLIAGVLNQSDPTRNLSTFTMYKKMTKNDCVIKDVETLFFFLPCAIISGKGENSEIIMSFIKNKKSTAVIYSEDDVLWQAVSPKVGIVNNKGIMDSRKLRKKFDVSDGSLLPILQAIKGNSELEPSVRWVRWKKIIPIIEKSKGDINLFKENLESVKGSNDYDKIKSNWKEVEKNFNLLKARDTVPYSSTICKGYPERIEKFLQDFRCDVLLKRKLMQEIRKVKKG